MNRGPGNQDPMDDPMEDHSEWSAREAVNGGPLIRDQPREVMSTDLATTTTGVSKDAMEENGEEILEAAEDTVIY